MIYDGEMTWRISRNKQIDLHVVLLEDLLVLLQRQDERLVMRCQSTNVVTGKEDLKLTHSPIIKLSSILTRNVATGICPSFYSSASIIHLLSLSSSQPSSSLLSVILKKYRNWPQLQWTSLLLTYKPIQPVVCAGALGRVKTDP